MKVRTRFPRRGQPRRRRLRTRSGTVVDGKPAATTPQESDHPPSPVGERLGSHYLLVDRVCQRGAHSLSLTSRRLECGSSPRAAAHLALLHVTRLQGSVVYAVRVVVGRRLRRSLPRRRRPRRRRPRRATSEIEHNLALRATTLVSQRVRGLRAAVKHLRRGRRVVAIPDLQRLVVGEPHA